MKSILFASVMISVSSTIAFAADVCGTLGSTMVSPHCSAGEACPMFVRLQYDLTTVDGVRYDLTTSDTNVLEGFGQLKGEKVCVNASEIAGSLEVTEISAQQ